MDFKNGVINIQAAGYNGAHTVYILRAELTRKRQLFSFLIVK